MARTRKYNIYYQDDYTQDADVLADNQAMAESIETALETVENKADNNTIEISNIKNGTSIDSFEDVEVELNKKQNNINSENKLSSDLVDDTNHTNKFVTASEKEQITTNATDISNIKDGTSIDSFGDVETALSGKEDSSNKTGVLNSSSTTAQYPHAKAVYDELVERDEEINQLWNDHPDILDNNTFPSGTDLTLNGTGDLKMKVDVGGNSTQIQYEGYNKFEPTLQNEGVDIDRNNVTATLNEDEFTFTPTNTSFYFGIAVPTGTTYQNQYGKKINVTNMTNISFLATNTAFDRIFITAFDSNNTSLGYTQFNTYKGTYTIPQNTAFIIARIGISASTVGTEYKTKFMLYEGTIEKPYEPYVGNQASPNPTYKQDINNVEGNVVVKGKSKNLATTDKDIILAKSTSGSVTLVDFGKDVTFDEMTFSLFFDNAIFTSNGNFCNLKKNDETNQFVNRSFFKNKNNELATANTLLNGRYSYTTTNVTFRKLIFFTHDNSYVFWTQGKFNALLEASSTPTDTFIPHAENTVTFPLSQGQKLMLGDTLEDDGIHHKRGKVVFDGSDDENWNRTISNDIARFDIIVADFKTGTSTASTATFLSNYFIAKGLNDLISGNIGISWWWSESSKRIVICLGDNKTTAEFKTWLSTHNTTVEYELAEEVIEAYTSAQQTAYDNLQEMQSYYDLTYVTGSSDNAQPILTAHAKKSLKVINDEISNINSRLTLLEE